MPCGPKISATYVGLVKTLAAAFLAPLAEPITAKIDPVARATLADVFKIARLQRQRTLQTVERSGRDMTCALVELVSNPETRRIISHVYTAISPDPATKLLTINDFLL